MSSVRLQHRDGFKPKLIALSVAACFGLSSTQSLANPTGGTVSSGSASFASSGNTLTVTNTANAIINWQNFSIGANEITRFLQSSGASAVLNRVVGANGVIPQSVIDGVLASNGRVFLLNSSGIVIGATARIDVAGFVASSLNLSDQDFLNGRLRFTETPGAGGVSNAGVIDTSSGGAGGRVFLIGPDVQNSGVIRSPQGEIVLAAGKSVELVYENSPFVTVRLTADNEQALNVGQLIADSGRIGMFGALVRQGGVVEANSAVVGANGEIRLIATQDLTLDAGSLTTANGPSGGTVTLQAQSGTNLISGTVEAKGSSGQGGTIQALGVRVGVIGNGVIDASGDAGGGTVLVGGDAHGANPNVQNADRTLIGPDGVIRADAGTTGDGGRVIVWADSETRVFGSISAQGGSQSGNGGFVETSSAGGMDINGLRVDTRAANGQWGTWLLDPLNVTIVASGGTDTIADVSVFGNLPTTSATINRGTIEGAFTTNGTVQIQATNDVNLGTDLNLSYGTPQLIGFEVRAVNNIDMAYGGTGAHTIFTNGHNVTLSANDIGVGAAGGPALNTVYGTGSIIGGGNIFTDYGGVAGGNIALSGYGVNVGTLETKGGLNVQGAPAGLVTITALSGGVQTGSITTRGIDGVDFNVTGPVLPTAGGTGGAINISAAYGSVVTGNIDASGGRGGNGGAIGVTVYAAQFGGNGGAVTIGSGPYGPTASASIGSITSVGGVGSNGQNNVPTAIGTASGGSGGIGGLVFFNNISGAVAVGAINTSGGSGGNGAAAYGLGYAGSGGGGGGGGAVTLASTSGAVTVGAILTSSGNGGNAGDSTGGVQFIADGGSVTITAGDFVATSAITTSGGNGGNGATTLIAPLGGRGGSINITATNSITTGAIAALGGSGSTGINGSAPIAGDAGAGGNVILSGSAATVVGAIDTTGGGGILGGGGAVQISARTGDITTGSITTRSLSPLIPGGGVTLATTNGRILVNGNIDTRGANGTGTDIDTCGDGCFTFTYGGSAGGSVAMDRTGVGDPAGGTAAIQVNGSILASGGNGFSPQGAAGGNGGTGGAVLISTSYGAVNIAGSIDVHAGYGGTGAAGYGGGYGGAGGAVGLFGASVSSGAINAAGGKGGDGGADTGTIGAGNGGYGGAGGFLVELIATGDIAVGNISAAGGKGGDGGKGYGVLAGTGGAGGAGSTTVLVSSSYGSIDMRPGGTISAAGGNGGAGGAGDPVRAGGNGGNGGYGGTVDILAYGNILVASALNIDGVSIPAGSGSISMSLLNAGLGGAGGADFGFGAGTPGVSGAVVGTLSILGEIGISLPPLPPPPTITDLLRVTTDPPASPMDALDKKDKENKQKKDAAVCK